MRRRRKERENGHGGDSVSRNGLETGSYLDTRRSHVRFRPYKLQGTLFFNALSLSDSLFFWFVVFGGCGRAAAQGYLLLARLTRSATLFFSTKQFLKDFLFFSPLFFSFLFYF